MSHPPSSARASPWPALVSAAVNSSLWLKSRTGCGTKKKKKGGGGGGGGGSSGCPTLDGWSPERSSLSHLRGQSQAQIQELGATHASLRRLQTRHPPAPAAPPTPTLTTKGTLNGAGKRRRASGPLRQHNREGLKRGGSPPRPGESKDQANPDGNEPAAAREPSRCSNSPK